MRRLVVGLLLAAGCSSTEPSPTTGTFVLRSIGGETLPAAVANPGSEMIVADTITISFDGLGMPLRLYDRHDYLQSGQIHPVAVSSQIELHGDQLTFLPVACPPGAFCIDTKPTGTLRGDSLTIAYASGIGLRTRIFTRR
jgi:hypothetical protein